MLKVTRIAPDGVDLAIDGQIDSAAMTEGLNALLEAAEDMENGRVLYRIMGFAMPTPGAFAVEFGYMPKLFGLIAKFSRIAVISDQSWIRTAAEIEGAVIPGLDIKAFEPGEDAAAEAWLAGDGSDGGDRGDGGDPTENVPV
ncbi:MAG: STAS/SEC14 domain-containing protein [Pseudomonadota bacterium]